MSLKNLEEINLRFIKVSKKNSLAEPLLSGNNPLKKGVIVFFFGNINIEEIYTPESERSPTVYQKIASESKKRKAMQWNQIKYFQETINNEQTYCITATSKTIYIYQLKGPIFILHDEGINKNEWNGWLSSQTKSKYACWDDTHFPKFIEIENLQKKEVLFAPEILATLSGSREFAYKTIAPINRLNIKYAIKKLFPEIFQDFSIPVEEQLIHYLGPIEFETLIFKLFSDFDCIVSGMRGGSRQCIDLLVYNPNSSDKKLNLTNTKEIIIPAKNKITIQIKHKRIAIKELESDWKKFGKETIGMVDIIIGLSFDERKIGKLWKGLTLNSKDLWDMLKKPEHAKSKKWFNFMIKEQYQYWINWIERKK
ncbi:hypothetical protein NEF87_004854 [Candidatus Lokiarchaeum ossiferum]|uniref:Uncharacterized protein n=1 Tax=Candidatus Lokiarchaeum ossiferum TaxID=2951803 RepID=A0ABY6I1J2_9ARCH|nr:hypothetical protein NEF87_004854 [Candidatus Lokiarchaeum sp. B-35]